MKASTFIATLLAAVPAFADLPNGLPDGAHNPRNENVARPNVCDDKCDVAFMKVYNVGVPSSKAANVMLMRTLKACLGGNSGEDCVDKSRLITCQGDFNVRVLSHPYTPLFTNSFSAPSVAASPILAASIQSPSVSSRVLRRALVSPLAQAPFLSQSRVPPLIRVSSLPPFPPLPLA